WRPCATLRVMPGRPTPLPVALAGRAFSTSEAMASGLTQGRLRGSDLVRPFHPVWTGRFATTSTCGEAGGP
ncbi:MAG TPA: hypothetical protein VLI66_03185, partial [Terrabacter sp.]|nr:hypothetical protein [Terrabacter sp.]